MNRALLLLIVALIAVFALTSTYYEKSLKNISMQYNSRLQDSAGKAVLENVNESIQLRDSFRKDRELLEKLYFDLKTENEGMQKQNEDLKAQVNSLKGDFDTQKANFDKLKEQYQQVQNSLIKSNEQASRLMGRVNELCRKLKDAGGNDEKC